VKTASVLAWLPLAFVAGGLVGAYGPSEELRTREERASEEKAVTKAKTKPKPSGAFGSFAQIVNIPDEAKRPRRPQPRVRPAAVATTNAADSASGSAEVVDMPSAPVKKPEKRLAPEDLKARIDEASEIWRTRIEIARASAVEKLGLDDAGVAAFDEAVASMNDRLRDSLQIVADQVASAEEMTPELGIRLMGDVSTSLAEAYDAIGACAGEGKRADVSKLNMADFIDPSVAEPFVSVQDKLEPGR